MALSLPPGEQRVPVEGAAREFSLSQPPPGAASAPPASACVLVVTRMRENKKRLFCCTTGTHGVTSKGSVLTVCPAWLSCALSYTKGMFACVFPL